MKDIKIETMIRQDLLVNETVHCFFLKLIEHDENGDLANQVMTISSIAFLIATLAMKVTKFSNDQIYDKDKAANFITILTDTAIVSLDCMSCE